MDGTYRRVSVKEQKYRDEGGHGLSNCLGQLQEILTPSRDFIDFFLSLILQGIEIPFRIVIENGRRCPIVIFFFFVGY